MVVLNMLGLIGNNIMKKKTMSNRDLEAYCDGISKENSSSSERWYKPYSELLGRQPDFEVAYKYISKTQAPFIGMKSNFKYKDDDFNQLWIIYPEFLDENGDVIIDRALTPASQGRASMWIFNDDNKAIHKSKIVIGTNAYWTFGPYILAEVLVTKVFF